MIEHDLGETYFNRNKESTKPKTILFINDTVEIREEATEILKEEGYKSLFADNYEEAVAYITDDEINIVMIILDINLLVENGIEIYDKIKEINPNLPVVTTSTAGHYRYRLGSDKKEVRFADGVQLDSEE